MKAWYTIILLVLSNSFMTLAWYGHLKFKGMKESLKWNHLVGFFFLVLAVYFVFRK